MCGTDRVKTIDPRAFRSSLLSWFAAERRDLPWRKDRDPYHVWVSEAMLQQTRAEVVRTRYQDFISTFPSVGRLADADVDDVVAAWSGLGYYARARNLHAAARIILRDHGGFFPRDLASALALPGIGPYMSRAVLSIAYRIPLAVVDGNVIRVLSRIAMIPSRSVRIVQAEADRLLDPDQPGDSNQALMELGATVCKPVSPRCSGCPMHSPCGARMVDRIGDFPPRSGRSPLLVFSRTIWVARDNSGRFWLERRTRPPLRGLWGFPWRESARDPMVPCVGILEHLIMNHRYSCEVVLASDGPAGIPGEAAGPGRWIEPARIASIPHSSLMTKTLQVLARHGRRDSGEENIWQRNGSM